MIMHIKMKIGKTAKMLILTQEGTTVDITRKVPAHRHPQLWVLNDCFNYPLLSRIDALKR